MEDEVEGVELDEKQLEHKQQFEKEQLEADDLQNAGWFRVFMTCVWVASAAVMIYYLTRIVDQHKSSKANPSSTILVIEKGRLPMPQIVICNWNQDGTVEDPRPKGDCGICNITLESCSYNISTDCMDEWVRRDYQTMGGLFSCYEYNGDIQHPDYSNTTGYSGSLSTVWSVPLPERADPPSSRVGLQATFLPVGSVTSKDIYNEIHFAPMGFDTFFSLKYVNTIHNELDPSSPSYNTSSYEASASMVNLLVSHDPDLNDDSNITKAYISISFAYQTLSLQQVTFDVAYNLNNLFGDFAGMIGTLMGLDVIKLAAGLPMGYLAWKSKSWKPLQEAFNG